MKYLLLIIIAFNFFVAGCSYTNRDFKGMWKLIFFGFPLYIYYVIKEVLKALYEFLNLYFRLQFFIDYYIKRDIKKYYKFEDLMDFDYERFKKREKKSLRIRSWIFVYKKIKKSIEQERQMR